MDENTQDNYPLTVRGRRIRVDEDGLFNLTDVWSAAGFKVNQQPAQWWRSLVTQKLAEALLERIFGNSPKAKVRVSTIFRSRGKDGTWAHPVLACAYAGYLSPKLEVEVREVWLRYRAGDPTLADDILERASPEANEWAATRAIGRATRSRYTSTLRQHGAAKPIDYAICTNETYLALFDRTAGDLRRDWELPKKSNLRDAMSGKDLAFVGASEALSTERIEETDARGADECQRATRTSARYIREAIDKDRADRKRR